MYTKIPYVKPVKPATFLFSIAEKEDYEKRYNYKYNDDEWQKMLSDSWDNEQAQIEAGHSELPTYLSPVDYNELLADDKAFYKRIDESYLPPVNIGEGAVITDEGNENNSAGTENDDIPNGFTI